MKLPFRHLEASLVLLGNKGTSFVFLVSVTDDIVTLKCTSISLAKVIEENTCLLKIIKIQ